MDRSQPPARPWYTVGQPWDDETRTVVGGEPCGSGPNGDPHIYDVLLVAPVYCPDCEDPHKPEHTPETHRRALKWAVHCVNQHDPATRLLAQAYTTLRDIQAYANVHLDGTHGIEELEDLDELLDDIREWLRTEPAGPIPSPDVDEDQTTITELLDIPAVETVGLCRCGGDVRWDPEDDISWCTNGCPGGPDIIDQEGLP